jgi:hypothetical protein
LVQLAALSGLSATAFSKALGGEGNVDEETANAIARPLGLTGRDLVKTNRPKSLIEKALEFYMSVVQARDLPEPAKPHALALVDTLMLHFNLHRPKDDDIEGTLGSLIVTFPVSRRDAEILMDAFLVGELEQFDIVSVALRMRVVPSPEEYLSDPRDVIDAMNDIRAFLDRNLPESVKDRTDEILRKHIDPADQD